jgi:hypothetical protein
MYLMQDKKITYIYAISAAMLIHLLSLPFLGLDIRFSYGLAFGTVVAIINHRILEKAGEWALIGGRGAGLIVAGYMIRLAIYGGAFLYALKLGTASGIACLLGFTTLKLGLIYVYGIRPTIQKRRSLKSERRQNGK